MRKFLFTIVYSLCAIFCCAACNNKAQSSGDRLLLTDTAISLAGDSLDALTETDTVTVAETLSVTVTGDIMLGTTYPTPRLPENEGRNVFDDVHDLIFNADVALGNLECAVSDSGTCTKGSGPNSFAFRTPPYLAERLKDVGYDYLGLANNHSNDFGPVGVQDTEATLDKLGIAYSGHKGHKPYAVIERGGLRIACMAFGQNTYSMRNTDYDLLRETIRDAKKESDLIFISLHGGAEGKAQAHLPRTGHEFFLGEDRGALREFAHIAIDEGADLVYGHGPHVTRCVEVYKGRFIAYSLGNFATPYGMNLTGISGYAPVVTLNIKDDGSFIDGKIHSFIQQPGIGPRLDLTNSVAQEMRCLTLADIDEPVIEISEDGTITLIQ